jgi:phage terminase large subunit-like protein
MEKPSPISSLTAREREILYQHKLDLENKRDEMIWGLPHLYGWKWYKWARIFHDSFARMKLLVAANQISKMLCNYSILPTFEGFKRVDEIRIGDKIINWEGQPTEVIDIPFIGDDECYEFEFDDGTSIVSSKDHMWWAKSYEERFRKTYTKKYKEGVRTWDNPTYNQWKLFSTKEIYERGKYSPETKATSRFSIPLCEPVDYPEKDIPDAYMLGIMLGDGCFRNNAYTLTNPEPEIGKYVMARGASERRGVSIRCLTYGCGFFRNSLKELGLGGLKSGDKFIPEAYLTASIEQRKALLAGLMDTDGTALKHGVYYYSTVSEKLATGITELVCSLGGKTRIAKREAGYKKDGEFIQCQDVYEVYVLTAFNPFRLEKKAKRWHPIRYSHERVIRKVTPVGKKAGRCFTVADHNGSFLATKNYIVTHNSSTQIRQMIHWATEPLVWPKISNREPRLFWYLYPTMDVIKTEVDTKWVPEFLPRGIYKSSEKYGWEIDRTSKAVEGIRFSSGVYLQFKTYGQGAKVLQTSTLDVIACDEELPEDMYDELNARLIATQGIFSMVFTATLGQEMWWRAMEVRGEGELFKDALKMNVSMYDCLKYEDGSPSPWTEQRIATIKSKSEILRRVYGRFVKDEGKKYPSFNPEIHFVEPKKIPTSYRLYAGVDIGTGGGVNHPAAITFIAVSPDYRIGYVVDGWRGDNSITTSADILDQFRKMKYNSHLNKYHIASQAYDHASKDFFLIATRAGEPFVPAKKNHQEGEDMINTLFKCGMLFIFDTDELRKLGSEIMSLMAAAAKGRAKDDFTDSMRYAITQVPWDWSILESADTLSDDEKGELLDKSEAIRMGNLSEDEVIALQIRERRGENIYGDGKKENWGYGEEIEEWNNYYGT